MITLACHRCRRELTGDRVGVRAVCEGCGAPLHACRNCAFWDPALANECREPGAERVADKEQANFCDFFRPVPARRPAAAAPDGARAALEALFRKNSSERGST